MTLESGAVASPAPCDAEDCAGREQESSFQDFSPARIVEELDRYIIGQTKAKRKVALALRNRTRRKQVERPLRDEIVPKNILMIGPTGVGKTEIARRLAKLSGSPFLKVEATKFTEVGYVGRDVDSIIRDLADVAYELVRAEHRRAVQLKAEEAAEERIIRALAGEEATPAQLNRWRAKLRKGVLENREIEPELDETVSMSSGFTSYEFPQSGTHVGVLNIGDIISRAVGGRSGKSRKMTVAEARKLLCAEEADQLLDQDKIAAEAIERAEEDGIVFLDEIDKISSRAEARSSGEVSREGVQRDLLPLLEGTSVKTPYGMASTDHILFIASGAFHLSSPSDLLPELQGRLPIRVELDPLSEQDLARILSEPQHSLIRQYTALLAAEGVELRFTDDGVRALAAAAAEVNANVENIGARRLQTVTETLLEEVSFSPERYRDAPVVVDAAYVEKHLGAMTRDVDLSRFIL